MTDELRFAKYQGTGNDFVMVVDLDDARHLDADVVARLCDRRTGVGADGLIRVVRSDRDDAAFEMDYRNADGSIAEMCGNGARCVGKLVNDLGLSDELSFAIVVGDQVRGLRLHPSDGEVRRVTVEMGAPAFAKSAIPMRGPAWETFLGEPFDIGGGMTLKASAVSMGNPHLVLFIEDDPDRFHVSHIGPVWNVTSCSPSTRTWSSRRSWTQRSVPESGSGDRERPWPAAAVRAPSPSRRTKPGWCRGVRWSASREGRSRLSAWTMATSC